MSRKKFIQPKCEALLSIIATQDTQEKVKAIESIIKRTYLEGRSFISVAQKQRLEKLIWDLDKKATQLLMVDYPQCYPDLPDHLALRNPKHNLNPSSGYPGNLAEHLVKHYKNKYIVEYLLELLESDDTAMQIRAALGLGHQGHAAALPILQELFKNHRTRYFALLSMQHIVSADALKLMADQVARSPSPGAIDCYANLATSLHDENALQHCQQLRAGLPDYPLR